MASRFYVYTHARPDGSIFYIGKGTLRRAKSLSPSRRSLHHQRVVAKHGARRIAIALHPCSTEEEAFALERRMIAEARAAGLELVNQTDGGEGVSGRPCPPKAKEAFRKWYGADRQLPPEALDKALEGLARGRAALAAKNRTPEGRAERVAIMQAARAAPRTFSRVVVCEECSRSFLARSPKARFCHDTCNQRWWRRRRGEFTGNRPDLLRLADLGDRAVERAAIPACAAPVS